MNNDPNQVHQAELLKDRSSVSAWYDGFTAYQRKYGVNIRHRTIFRYARAAGVRNGMDILEIGCGIGSLTSLLAANNAKGRILSLDISPKSVEMARKLLAGKRNVSFLVSDMSDFQNPFDFDFVVLADVIEHIPLDQHPRLFRTIDHYLKPGGKVLINIPAPQLLEYYHLHDPGALQIIDQPVHADRLMNDVYRAGLVLDSFVSYGLAHVHIDYQFIVLRKRFHLEQLRKKNIWVRRWAEMRARLNS